MKTAPRDLARLAAASFDEGPALMRALQRWRPYICPFDVLIDAVPPNSIVLDVGCGGGLFLALLWHHGRVERGVGFDMSPSAIEVAQAMARRLGAALEFLHRTTDDPWPQGAFDVVSIVDVMHHVPPAAQRAVFAQAAAKVRPGGRLVYKDMCRRPHWRALANRAHDLVLARQWINYVPIETIEAWAEDAGLVLEEASRLDRLWYGHELRVFVRPA